MTRPMNAGDWAAVEEIYGEGIEDGHATFETTTPSWDSFDASKHPELRVVAVRGGQVVGWAAASPVSARPAYRGVVEHSVYVRRDARGAGIGRLLLEALLARAEDIGIWTVQSAVFPENTASVRLHERCGFRVVGRRERIARSERGPDAGRWRDTLLIERRSVRNGTEANTPG